MFGNNPPQSQIVTLQKGTVHVRTKVHDSQRLYIKKSINMTTFFINVSSLSDKNLTWFGTVNNDKEELRCLHR